MHKIVIARDFSATPGARYETDGPFSGQAFRRAQLEPLFADASDESVIDIMLDGTAGYATSFLEEAFGGLARMYGSERCRRRLHFTSTEDSLLVSEIEDYINDASIK